MDELQALYEILQAHLGGASPVWTQVAPVEVVPADAVKPYLHFFWAGGGNEQGVPVRTNARITLSVKGVALTLAEALAMKDAAADLLRNSGSQDVNPRLPAHAAWEVLNVTQDRVIYLEESFQGGQRIYHAGNQYEFVMERK